MNLTYHEIDSLVLVSYKKRQIKDCLLLMQAGQKKAELANGKLDSTYILYSTNVGFFYSGLGQKDKALSCYIRTKDLSAELYGKEHPSYAKSLNNIAHIYQRRDEYAKALPLFKEAQAIVLKARGSKNAEYVRITHDLGLLYGALDKNEKALEQIIIAKKIGEEVLGEKNKKVIGITITLAKLYSRKGAYAKAMDLASNALSKNLLDKNSLDRARIYLLLADIYEKRQDFQDGITALEQAQEIYIFNFGKECYLNLFCLNRIANLYHNLGDSSMFGHIIEQSLQISTRTTVSFSAITEAWADTIANASFSANLYVQRTLKDVGLIYSALNNRTDSLALRQKKIISTLANTLIGKLRNSVAYEKDKLRFLEQSSYWLNLTLTNAALDDVGEAFRLADQNKSVLLMQSLKTDEFLSLGNLPDSLVKKSKRLQEKLATVETALQKKNTEVEQNKLLKLFNQVSIDLDVFTRDIEQKYPEYYELKYQQKTVELADIQSNLNKGAALVEYVLLEKELIIFFITKDTVQCVKQAIDIKSLEDKIKQFHENLSDYSGLKYQERKTYQLYTDLAYWFYKKLLSPVLEEQKDIKKLYIITDGALGHLPFEAFLTKPVGQQKQPYKNLAYLINDYIISYNYSAALWHKAKQKKAVKNNKKVLALAGDYTLKMDSRAQELRSAMDEKLRATFAPLFAAQEEVLYLKEQFKGDFLFGKAASEANFKNSIKDYAVVHFATHGILDNKRPMLSSLVLTEDGNKEEDNFLRAHEISKLNLKTNLVVLSACETGYGRFEQGNGIASLARSFMYAGADALIVSLWKVNDGATALLMKELYDNLNQGINKDEALRQAKLNYIQNAKGYAAHPVFWSPFIQIGNEDSIEFAPSFLKSRWPKILLSLLLILVSLVVFRNKWMKKSSTL